MKPLKIMTASDLHYLSPSLHDSGPLFRQTMNTADGKYTHYSAELCECLFDTVKKEKPEYLLLSGDLTFNGEKQSHLELAEYFRKLENEGTKVLLIPGNHDVNYHFSCKYKGDSYKKVANVTPEEFEQIYYDCGYGGALSRDPNSLSYLYELEPGLWLLALDANVNGEKGALSKATLEWAEPWLRAAKNAGTKVFTMTHQNILSHNLLTSPGYVLFNHEEVEAMMKKYGVVLNLSGHMHIQHIKVSGPYTTIASGSLSISPNLYGTLDVHDNGLIDYHASELDVDGWAKAKGLKDPNLRDFKKRSKAYFNQVWGMQINQELNDYGVSPLERVGMVYFCTKVINDYLSGKIYLKRKEYLEDPLYRTWKKLARGSFFEGYISSILDDPANSISDREITIDMNRNKAHCKTCEPASGKNGGSGL